MSVAGWHRYAGTITTSKRDIPRDRAILAIVRGFEPCGWVRCYWMREAKRWTFLTCMGDLTERWEVVPPGVDGGADHHILAWTELPPLPGDVGLLPR